VDDSDYQAPFPFTGKLERITVDLGESTLPFAAMRASMVEMAKKRDR
jgi:arylsulfatase